MSRTWTKIIISTLSILAVLGPIIVHVLNAQWGSGSIIQNIFPIFGLLAASLLWLHAISGVWEDRLRELFDFHKFVHITSSLILFSIILHPLLLFWLIKFNLPIIFGTWNWPLMFGVMGWLLLITYDMGKPFRDRGFFLRHWNKILIISNIGFLLTFLHSLNLGSDLQSGFLRYLWMTYGITGALAIIYTYGVKLTRSKHRQY